MLPAGYTDDDGIVRLDLSYAPEEMSVAYCPNSDCPDFRITEEPQEFRLGITHCSACKATLVEERPFPVLLAPIFRRLFRQCPKCGSKWAQKRTGKTRHVRFLLDEEEIRCKLCEYTVWRRYDPE
jgi:hypothetical protein